MAEDIINEEQVVPLGAQVVLPPYGFVRLVEWRADDLDVVNAARVSFAKQSGWAWEIDGKRFESGDDLDEYLDGVVDVEEEPRPVLREDDEKVLRYLLRNRHGTPFEHTFFKFHIRAPIFVFREWHRHRIGISINEESARYSPLQPHFYLPERDAVRRQVGRPGAYTYERVEDDDVAQAILAEMKYAYRVAYEGYETMMKRGVAKELARAVLPVGIYSQMYWTCNARSLMAFLSLRAHPAAQREIRLYAEAMEQRFADIMPVTHSAFVENGRQAP